MRAEVIGTGLKALKQRGKLLTTAYTGKVLTEFDMDMVIAKQATNRSVRGDSYEAVELALNLMARKSIDLTPISTHHFALDMVDHAPRLVGGEIQDDATHVTVQPWN